MHSIDWYEALSEGPKKKYKPTMKERKGENLNYLIENYFKKVKK